MARLWFGRVDGSWAGRGCLEGGCWCRCGWWRRWGVEEDGLAAMKVTDGRMDVGTYAIKEYDNLKDLEDGLLL